MPVEFSDIWVKSKCGDQLEYVWIYVPLWFTTMAMVWTIKAKRRKREKNEMEKVQGWEFVVAKDAVYKWRVKILEGTLIINQEEKCILQFSLKL